MNEIRENIKQVLEGSENPCLLLSFGKDSLLLLWLIREVCPSIGILWYSVDITREQRRYAEKIIKLLDLTVYSYLPSDRYFLPNKEGLSIISEYSMGGSILPNIRDIEDGDVCAITLNRNRTPHFVYPFDTTFVGWKSTDEHFIVGKNFFPPDGVQLGPTKLFAPLRDLTDTQVLSAIKELDIPYEEVDDTIQICTSCLQAGSEKVYCPAQDAEIPRIVWNQEKRLSEFRQRFGFEAA